MWDEEIIEGGHVGTTTHQGVPGGPGAPRWVVHLPLILFAPTILKYSEKNRIKFSEHSENFYFWVIFIAREIQKTDKTWHLILFN